MGTGIEATQSRIPSAETPIGHYGGWFSWKWPDLALFDVALSALIGFAYILLLLGPAPLNPTNISWLKGDLVHHYIGWALFSQSPGWHWPLTFTDRIGYPIGDSVANVDLNSFAALLLKPFASFLPSHFQYLGPWAVLSISLQFYFGVRLLRIFFGRQLWPLVSGGLLLAISPALMVRLALLDHFSLSNHWLILAAFCLYFEWQHRGFKSIRRVGILWCSLAVLAVTINPYLAFCVMGVLGAACLRSVLVRPPNWQGMILVAALAICSFLVGGYTIGVIRFGGGFAEGGYRMYSMNLLAPIDSLTFTDDRTPGSILLKAQRQFPGQYEGYNYLGLGVLALSLVLAGGIAATRWHPKVPLSEWVPLFVLSLLFTALAASTKVTAGSHVLFDVDPHERLSPYLAVFRSSGRLFWVPYYLITVGMVVALFRVFQKQAAAIFAIVILLLQFADLAPTRAAARIVNQPPANPLHSPVWGHLGEKHANLLIFPPGQCDRQGTPGGNDGLAIFGMLAAAQHMRTNSYFSSRYSPQSLAWHCGEGAEQLLLHLRDDSAYVVTPNLAAFVALNNPQPNLCHRVDGFILCSKVTDFGLGPGAKFETPALDGDEVSFGPASSAKYLVDGWWAIEPWGVWSNGDAILWFRVSDEQLKRFNNVVLTFQVPIYKKAVKYTITSGNHVLQGSLTGSGAYRVERLDAKFPLQPSAGSANVLRLKMSDPVRPIDAGLNSDTRELGAGILSLRLVP